MKRIIFGHIVNHRRPKGSHYVWDITDKVRMKGFNFGFHFAECIEHDHALNTYRQIDVLLEQFVIGWYGAQAVEFMAMGKPVVVFLHPDDLKIARPQMQSDIPVISSSHWQLEETLIEIIQGKHDLALIGEQGRQFVKRWHDPEKIAAKLIKDYESVGGR